MMHAIPLVRASVVRPVREHLEKAGVALGPRLTSARALLDDPTALVPVATAGSFFEEARRSSGREDVGLWVGAAVSLPEFGDWGSILASCGSVAAFVAALTTTARRFNSGQRFWAVRRGGDAWLFHRLSSRVTSGRRVATEFALMLVLKAIRLAAGPDWRPREIHLEGPAPAHADQLAALADERIEFGQPCTAMVFPMRTLERRFPSLLGAAPAVARARIPSSDFEGSIRQVVESLMRLGTAELGAAAAAARLSERTLQRHLSEHGLSFTRLVEEARFESACRLLEDPSVKIVDISAELGYTDSANFTRAFRRWSGVAPQVFRSSA